jgi:hypothetical protein
MDMLRSFLVRSQKQPSICVSVPRGVAEGTIPCEASYMGIYAPRAWLSHESITELECMEIE